MYYTRYINLFKNSRLIYIFFNTGKKRRVENFLHTRKYVEQFKIYVHNILMIKENFVSKG